MKTSILWAVSVLCSIAVPLSADVVILRDGSSYSGHLRGGQILFTGKDGVGFTFPLYDVQSLVFNTAGDTITLNNGKTYSGHYTGSKELNLVGQEGVSYSFPTGDITSLVLTRRTPQAAHQAEQNTATANGNTPAKVIAEGTRISITTNERIDSSAASDGQLFAATITNDVTDNRGAVAIHGGTPAKLVVRNVLARGPGSTPELVLDLDSVSVSGHQFRTVTSNVVENGRESVGANRRTLEYAGGGGGLGALLGAAFGGGRGAGIGALAGAGGGALTQFFTRGNRIIVPAETVLTFSLERTLVLRPVARSGTASSN